MEYKEDRKLVYHDTIVHRMQNENLIGFQIDKGNF